VGPCVTGKSHIAQALGHCAICAGYDVLFTTASKMLAQMNAARANNGLDRHFSKLTAVDLLIIDDLGLKPLQEPQDVDFHDVIAERYERKSTIVTSNLDIPEWIEAFPNRILGAATIHRLRHGVYKIVLDGKSYHSTQPAPKPQIATTGEKAPKTAKKITPKGGEKPPLSP
jgi:DNA replication protein DnaC